jgi:predicted component of type VI protein secretion system
MEWLVVLAVSVLAIIAVSVMAKQRRAERERLAQLEAQNQAIMRQYGVSDPNWNSPDPYASGQFSTPYPGAMQPPAELPSSRDPRLDEVLQLAARGEKIQAIKRYREITGVGLAEAKRVVDQMAGPV